MKSNFKGEFMCDKPIIIFDTDMDTDCDDAGALLLLIKAHLAGDITLGGVIADSICEYAAPFCKDMLSYYNLDIPVGEIYGHIHDENRFSDYLNHQKACEHLAYNKMLSKRSTAFYGSTNLYLSLFENAKDKSITVLCVGMLTAVYETLKVNPSLFEKKVEKVVIMGNPYKKNDFNLCMDAYATKYFFELCPCPIFISYLGREIITGDRLDKVLQPNNPVRQAYKIWSGGKGRSSWDLIAALFAMNPKSSIFTTSDSCKITYCIEEKESIISHENGGHKIISLSCSNDDVRELINGLLTE